jgi:hypothetical protein
MGLNRLFADQPQPEIAGSVRLLGNVHVGARAILAQGTLVCSHGRVVVTGNHSAVLEKRCRHPRAPRADRAAQHHPPHRPLTARSADPPGDTTLLTLGSPP